MRTLITALIIVSCCMTSDALSPPAFSNKFKVDSSDLVSLTKSTDVRNYNIRSLRSSTTTNADNDSNKHKGEITTNRDEDAEERVMDAATLAKRNDIIEDIIMRMAYQHWFEGGKTTADVRLIMGLPAKGEAVGAANWGKYLKYLEFLKEKEVQAANAAKVEAIKWRLTYKGWYLEGKTFRQVREKLRLPVSGEAKDFVNWEKYLDYLKYIKEYSQQVV